MRERGWGERAFLTQHTGWERAAGTAAAPVVFGVFASPERGGSKSTYARSCNSPMLLRAGARRGGSPVQHTSHTRKGEICKSKHHSLYSIKRRGNITLLHCTTTQSIGGIAFPLLPKLLKKDQDEQGQQAGISPTHPSARPGAPSLQRRQQVGGREPASQNPECERVKSSRKKNWVAVAPTDLPLSSYIWESIYCNLQVHCSSGGSNGDGF